MRKIAFALSVFVCVVSAAFAQTTTPSTPPPPAEQTTLEEELSWMIGAWEGEGKSRGEHPFLGKIVVTSQLDGNGVLIDRQSMTVSGDPTGGHKELMLIGYDGTTKKIVATMYDNKSAIALYVGELSDKQIKFNLATAQPGYVATRTFRLTPEGALSFTIEGAVPGKEVTTQVAIEFKKK